jgi:hypothetical protein
VLSVQRAQRCARCAVAVRSRTLVELRFFYFYLFLAPRSCLSDLCAEQEKEGKKTCA